MASLMDLVVLWMEAYPTNFIFEKAWLFPHKNMTFFLKFYNFILIFYFIFLVRNFVALQCY